MKKKIMYLFLAVYALSYTATNFNITNQLVVIYKVLDPLTVVVDTPEKMIVKHGKQSFLYSEVVTSQKPLEVRVQAPYNERDEILDRIYGTATLELRNNGRFTLTETSNATEKIEGKGFFPSAGEGSSKVVLPLYSGSTPANRYDARINLDARFNEENKEMLIGVYKGVLFLDVIYGE